jgi:hypothetical protein
MIDEYLNIIDLHLILIYQMHLVNNQIQDISLLNYKIRYIIVVNLIENNKKK